MSENINRRHLNESQRALVAAKIANLEHGQRATGADLRISPITQDRAAAMLNVGKRSVRKPISENTKIRPGQKKTPDVMPGGSNGGTPISMEDQTPQLAANRGG